MGGGKEGVRESNEGVEQTKVKYIHSRDTLRNPLNIDLGINNERQDCKMCTGAIGGCSWGLGQGEQRRLR
jgi:hypothetical protein